MRRIVFGTTMTLWAWLLAAPAYAAGDGERVGENVGHLLGGWAKSLYVGIAAVVALMFLLNRKFADLALFMIAAVLVGGTAIQGGSGSVIRTLVGVTVIAIIEVVLLLRGFSQELQYLITGIIVLCVIMLHTIGEKR